MTLLFPREEILSRCLGDVIQLGFSSGIGTFCEILFWECYWFEIFCGVSFLDYTLYSSLLLSLIRDLKHAIIICSSLTDRGCLRQIDTNTNTTDTCTYLHKEESDIKLKIEHEMGMEEMQSRKTS